MAERSAKILPERRVRSRIIRRKKHHQHQRQPAHTRRTHENSQHQPKSNAELAVSHRESDRRGMRQNKIPQHRFHKRIHAAFQNLLIQNWNPPPNVNCVPNTLYSPKIRKNTPTPMRSAASARVLLLSCAASLITNAHDTTECVCVREYRSRQRPHGAAIVDVTPRGHAGIALTFALRDVFVPYR